MLDILTAYVLICTQARALGPTSKEAKPMSLTEAISLLMLVIAAVSLGIQIKK